MQPDTALIKRLHDDMVALASCHRAALFGPWPITDAKRHQVAQDNASVSIAAANAHLTAAPQASEPTRSQKLAAAGFTARPSLRAKITMGEMRQALELIAAPKRPDGTWNRDREACRELAAEALGRYDDEDAAPQASEPAVPAAPTDSSKPTTYLQRFGNAMQLLCGGKRPSDQMMSDWLDITQDSFDLQEFAIEHGPAWAQGIGLIDAARALADQPTEGVEHEDAPAAPAAGEVTPWRCFHCDETFADRDAAALHFGASEHDTPACRISIEHVRWLEAQHHRGVEDDTEALRTIRSLVGEHEKLRRQAEEQGYAKGLADARKHPEELGLTATPTPPADIVRDAAFEQCAHICKAIAARHTGRALHLKGWFATHAAGQRDGAHECAARIMSALRAAIAASKGNSNG